VTLGGHALTLRLLAAGDREAVLAFAQALPEHDLLFLRRDITRPDNVDAWLSDIEEGRYVTVIAVEGANVVGYATVATDRMTWTRHVAELRVLVAPSARGIGLGALLTEQAFALAQDRGVRKMIAQMTTDQDAAVRAFERMGFVREAVLRGQVMDRDGGLHDLQIMGLDVEAFRARLDLATFQAGLPSSEI
jgi:L-amino acid N-acyltransferase YncA